MGTWKRRPNEWTIRPEMAHQFHWKKASGRLFWNEKKKWGVTWSALIGRYRTNRLALHNGHPIGSFINLMTCKFIQIEPFFFLNLKKKKQNSKSLRDCPHALYANADRSRAYRRDQSTLSVPITWPVTASANSVRHTAHPIRSDSKYFKSPPVGLDRENEWNKNDDWPSTHNFSTSVWTVADLSPTQKVDRTSSPTKRTFPACRCTNRPSWYKCHCNLVRNHSAALLPLALPYKR